MTVTVILVVATAGLLAAPALTRPLRRRMRPADAARVEATSLITGLLIAETAFIVCAAPILVIAFGVQPFHRLGTAHLFPGGSTAGIVSLLAAVAFPTYLVVTIRRTVRDRRHIARAARMGGSEFRTGEADILVHRSSRSIAMAVPGRRPVIVLSDHLCDQLTDHELELVVRHELAHVRFHSKVLLIVGVVQPLARIVPFLRKSVDVLRLSLERWADEAAIETEDERTILRQLLLRVAVEEAPASVAALCGVEEMQERTNALDRPVPVSPIPTWVAIAGFTFLASTAIASLVSWISLAQ